mmetsp:Transcript_17559/g.19756  ORF Transcript_17559/g.19756 Transcript_17559/m.19756 type:complete len:204 (+) Transcript_17559:36-647(+)
MSLFHQTKRFKEATDLINKIAAKKLPLLASRILDNLSRKENGQVFSEKEQTKVLKLFSIAPLELDTIMDASSYIFEQAAYHNLNAQKLAGHLAAAGVAQPQAQAFGVAWDERREAFLTKLRNHTLGAPLVLNSVDWRLQLTMGQQTLTKTKDINTIINFGIGSADAEAKEGEDLTVEMDHDALLNFYNSMEKIQSQLDAMSKS